MIPSRLIAICRSVISLRALSSGLLATLIRRAVSAASLPTSLASSAMPMSDCCAASRMRRAASGRVGRTS
ncbi:hypothetical protein D3C78_1654150 [compost metagenome]